MWFIIRCISRRMGDVGRVFLVELQRAWKLEDFD